MYLAAVSVKLAQVGDRKAHALYRVIAKHIAKLKPQPVLAYRKGLGGIVAHPHCAPFGAPGKLLIIYEQPTLGKLNTRNIVKIRPHRSSGVYVVCVF